MIVRPDAGVFEMNGLRKWTRAVAIGLSMSLAMGSPNAAEHETTSEEESSAAGGWQFSVAPYVWTSGAQGSATIDGTTVDIDSRVGDTFDLLGSLEAGGGMAVSF